MKIKLFLINRIDCSAMPSLASLIYSQTKSHRIVTQVKISDRGVEFVRPLFLSNSCVPLSKIGLECRTGVVYAKGGMTLPTDYARTTSKYQAIANALRHLTGGFLTEVTL